MNKQNIIDILGQKYGAFIEFINELSHEAFMFSLDEKWTAGQQLEHIVLCVKPLVQVFGMDKSLISQNFGESHHVRRNYKVLLEEYLAKLGEGGKAPSRFVPAVVLIEQREVLIDSLRKLIDSLCNKIASFTEEELDILCIPHPLLGSLTLREMLYNAIYHVEHHQVLAKGYLVSLHS